MLLEIRGRRELGPLPVAAAHLLEGRHQEQPTLKTAHGDMAPTGTARCTARLAHDQLRGVAVELDERQRIGNPDVAGAKRTRLHLAKTRGREVEVHRIHLKLRDL